MAEVILDGTQTSINKADQDVVLSSSVAVSQPTTVTAKSITSDVLKLESGRLVLKATGNIVLNNTTSSGLLDKSISNAALSLDTKGDVVISKAIFGQGGYNCLEIGATTSPKNVTISDSKFTGTLTNNAVLVFGTQANGTVTFSNCEFEDVSNVLRLSNKDNVKGVVVKLENCKFKKWESNNLEYAGFLIMQDYMSKDAAVNKADDRFNRDKITVYVNNCTGPDGAVIAPTDLSAVFGSGNNQLAYIYNNGEKGLAYKGNEARYPQFIFDGNVIIDTQTSVSFPNDDITVTTAAPIAKPVTITAKSVTSTGLEINNGRLAVKATNDVNLSNIVSSGTLEKSVSNAAISIDTDGAVTVKDCTFDQKSYNYLEIGLGSTTPGNITLENLQFNSELTNNSILVFGQKANSTLDIKNCYAKHVSNFLRLSNKGNVSGLVANIEDCVIDRWDTEQPWVGFLIMEDYIGKTAEANKADDRFNASKITVNVKNMTGPNGDVIVEDVATVLGTFDENQVAFIHNDYEREVYYAGNESRYPIFNFTFESGSEGGEGGGSEGGEGSTVPGAVEFVGVDTTEWNPETGFDTKAIASSLGDTIPLEGLDLDDPAVCEKVIKEYGLIKYLKEYPREILLDKLVKDGKSASASEEPETPEGETQDPSVEEGAE